MLTPPPTNFTNFKQHLECSMAKTVIHHLRIPLRRNEIQADALQRAQKELKLTDEELKEYQIHFIAFTPVTIRGMR